ncbi:MAG: phosphonate ABC transporter ATP-binding protein [Bacteroidetes bacterium GWF2_38_335]|nr:MAG: phosphonate ABC transporter ATP-binding protein [Bacteroidetes bacterium GWF2_38_335]OFY80734.1 MAG: phosphonate ABC transporter ATP-binding protein [Bacteroidetes bacterium RIFOXYA12_FULL_38_20]HBS87028.1 phosphonate ABC transporter ATP-binding protein [Bacteroidales bacterium]
MSDFCISLDKVSIFQQDKLVLSDVDFKVKNGEFVYLIGRVGAGKTSMIKTLNAELSLKAGEASISGFSLNNIRKKDVPKLRRKLGIVFQDFQLLNDRTIYDNLLFVLKATGWKGRNEINEKITNVLSKVGLEDKMAKMPHQLSGGEQQRVVIARALLNDPEIILADEPTGNLDPETSNGIMELLFDICANGKAVVMATHNYTLLKKFPARTVKCENGKFTEITDEKQAIDFSELD